MQVDIGSSAPGPEDLLGCLLHFQIARSMVLAPEQFDIVGAWVSISRPRKQVARESLM